MNDVTIGVPVYNGADTIREALLCLLEGTCQNIKIIVSDNCSDDDTVAIIKKIAGKDSRVTLFEQSENIGAVGNFRFVAEQAQTPFFAWRAHDDISDHHYIERLRNVLLENEKASLVAPYTVTSKLKGDKQRPFSLKLPMGKTANISSFPKAEAGWFYGLYRTEAAQQGVSYTDNNYPHVWGWDFMVILNALLTGGVVGCNETRFIHRLHGPPADSYNFSKHKLRQIAKDFYKTGEKLARQRHFSRMEFLVLKIQLWRLILRRIVRLPRML